MNSANTIKGLVNHALDELERVKTALGYVLDSNDIEGEVATATYHL